MRILMLLPLICFLIGCGEAGFDRAEKEGYDCGRSGIIDTLACPYRPDGSYYHRWKQGWIEGRKEFVASNKGKQ